MFLEYSELYNSNHSLISEYSHHPKLETLLYH
jgi:hypothetical protein